MPKWRVNTKVDPSRLDPNLKVIISQCDTDIKLPRTELPKTDVPAIEVNRKS